MGGPELGAGRDPLPLAETSVSASAVLAELLRVEFAPPFPVGQQKKHYIYVFYTLFLC